MHCTTLNKQKGKTISLWCLGLGGGGLSIINNLINNQQTIRQTKHQFYITPQQKYFSLSLEHIMSYNSYVYSFPLWICVY